MLKEKVQERAERKKKRFLDKNFLTKAIYGTLIVYSVLLSLEGNETSFLRISLSVLFSSLVILISEVYSEVVAEIINKKRRLAKREFLHVFKHSLPVLYASQIPTLTFIIAEIFNSRIETVFFITKISGVLTLFTYGFLVGKRLFENSWVRSLYTALITAGIGYGIILLKTVLH